MTRSHPHATLHPSRALRWTALAAALLTGLTVALGSMVCALDASAACPDWPGCTPGSILPSGELPPVLEFTHRVVAILTTPAILGTAILGLRHRRARLRILPWVSLACALAAGVFGMMIVKFSLPMPLAVLDLSLSLVALTLTTATAFAAARPADVVPAGPVHPLAYGVVGSLLVAHALGVVVAGPGEYVRCMSWPTGLPDEGAGPLGFVRLGLFALTALGMVAVAVLSARAAGRVLPISLVPLAILLVSVALAPILQGGDGALLAPYSVVAVAIYWSVSAAAARLSGPGRRAPSSVSASASRIAAAQSR